MGSLSVGMRWCHSAATEITLARLKQPSLFCSVPPAYIETYPTKRRGLRKLRPQLRHPRFRKFAREKGLYIVDIYQLQEIVVTKAMKGFQVIKVSELLLQTLHYRQ